MFWHHISMSRYQLWVSKDSQTFFRVPNEQAPHFAHEDEAVLTWEVEAFGHNDAMTKYYGHMGWDPYKPMLCVDGTPFPQDEDDECGDPDYERGHME
jgi:hypothetical protein